MYKLYDITNNDSIGLGRPKRIRSSIREMYYIAYRNVRAAYNASKRLQLLIDGENGFSMTISSFSTFGILICIDNKALWVRDAMDYIV